MPFVNLDELLTKALGPTATRAAYPHAPHAASLDEFKVVVSSFTASAEAKGLIVSTTPEPEMREIEQFLGLTPYSLPDGQLVATKTPNCVGCGRSLTFKDVVVSGARVHSVAFMRDAVTGVFGHLVNESE